MTNKLIWRVYKKESPKAPMLLVGTVLGSTEEECRSQIARNHWKAQYRESSPEDEFIFMN